MYFATDPVAFDKTGLKDHRREARLWEWPRLRYRSPHIKVADLLGPRMFNNKKIDVRKLDIGYA